MIRQELKHVYEDRHRKALQKIELSLQTYISDLVSEASRVDRVSVRAKAPDRFLDKAFKTDENGNAKYTDPLSEIQDQLGSRITVFYLSDVSEIKKIVLQYFTPIEIQKKEPTRNSEFGYFGEHFILKIPDDVVPAGLSDSDYPEFFELQIKTLFQHAWSEADHDLAYKSVRALDQIEQRQIAFSAAQAWGADRIFQELAEKLVPGMTRE